MKFTQQAARLGITTHTLNRWRKDEGAPAQWDALLRWVAANHPKYTPSDNERPAVTIHGLTPIDGIPNAENVWERVKAIQAHNEKHVERRYSQKITIPVGGDGYEANKLLAVNAGNHDNRTKEIAGVDLLRELLHGIDLLYDTDEVLFTLEFGGLKQLWKLRHAWKYRSALNPFHPFMRDLERIDDFDVAVGGHVHSGSHFAKWDHHSREANGPTDRIAFLIGTYEYHSKYGKQCGFGRHTGRGSITLIVFPDGRSLVVTSPQEAEAYLTWARDYFPADVRPVGIVLMSDLHLGNAYTDYQQLHSDLVSIRNTPGLYAMILGDCFDNWIGKLQHIQRNQPISHQEEISLLRSTLGILTGDPKYCAGISGG